MIVFVEPDCCPAEKELREMLVKRTELETRLSKVQTSLKNRSDAIHHKTHAIYFERDMIQDIEQALWGRL